MTRTPALLLLAASALPATGARAAESYDSCTGFIDSLPATINTQGVWCMRKDLATLITNGAAITVNNNNVTIDCNHFKLGGLGAGPDTSTKGITATDRLNVVVRRCNIRGFAYGIDLSGSAESGAGGHLIEDNRLESNRYIAISLNGDGSVVRGNQVRDTGGSPVAWAGVAFGINTGSTVDVIDNLVDGVQPVPSGGNAYAFGITFFDDFGGSVRGNRVRGLFAAGEGSSVALQIQGNSPVHVRDNDLTSTSDHPLETGIRCITPDATLLGNIVIGFAVGVQNCNAVAPDANGNVVRDP